MENKCRFCGSETFDGGTVNMERTIGEDTLITSFVLVSCWFCKGCFYSRFLPAIKKAIGSVMASDSWAS